MTMKKKLKVAAGSLLGIMFLFSAVLLIHIVVMVKNRKPLPAATLQMARADFKQPVPDQVMQTIQQAVSRQKGVKETYYNAGSRMLVYTYDNKVNTAEAIYASAIRPSGMSSERHLVSQSEATKGCPAMDNHSFYGKLTNMVARVVN
ncbi:hypothetical protein B0I18_102170 [Taibaiella chishuiensis]|uniref:Uncharacterized protein n=2 Tax=Taibaiella chishuiensis TaxID=1434707 RepID=A0A2P8D7J4_9BACT|nr:hypothetical protein B0I18_102170 [Taibaiella chishuiensis]